MKNYPDNVTGNEPEIAGYHEGSRGVYCDVSEAKVVFRHGLDEATACAEESVQRAGRATEPIGQAAALQQAVNYLLKAIKEGDEILVDCDFGGYVDGSYVDDLFVWTCPQCGTEHETELA